MLQNLLFRFVARNHKSLIDCCIFLLFASITIFFLGILDIGLTFWHVYFDPSYKEKVSSPRTLIYRTNNLLSISKGTTFMRVADLFRQTSRFGCFL